jgi:hypothetical protein
MNNHVVKAPLNPSVQCAGSETVVFRHNLASVMNVYLENLHTCDIMWTSVTLLNCLYKSAGAKICGHLPLTIFQLLGRVVNLVDSRAVK